MSEITIVRGDINFILNFTIYDADNEIVDLTGASTITLKFKSYEDGTVTSISGTIADPPGTDGEAQFNVGETFKSLIGEFKAEIEITFGPAQNNKVITAPNISIKVIADIA